MRKIVEDNKQLLIRIKGSVEGSEIDNEPPQEDYRNGEEVAIMVIIKLSNSCFSGRKSISLPFKGRVRGGVLKRIIQSSNF